MRINKTDLPCGRVEGFFVLTYLGSTAFRQREVAFKEIR